MSEQIWDMTLEDFRDAVVSRSTPGCGAAAAVAADLGLGLVLKGLRISESKESSAERAALIERGEALLSTLGAHAEEDIQAFKAYMAASRRAKEDDADSGDLEEATWRINGVPLATAETGAEALALAVDALPLTAKPLQSDTIAGGVLLHGGLKAVLLSVDSNLSGLEDATERQRIASRREALQEQAERHVAWLEKQRANL